jgi:hypothetical protein
MRGDTYEIVHCSTEKAKAQGLIGIHADELEEVCAMTEAQRAAWYAARQGNRHTRRAKKAAKRSRKRMR